MPMPATSELARLFPAGVRKCHRKACPVVKRFKSRVRYCCQSCASKDGGLRVGIVEARQRAEKAARAAGEARRRRALERADQYETKRDAWLAGYGNGYDKGVKAGEYKGYLRARKELAHVGMAGTRDAGAGGAGRRRVA